MSVSDTDIAFGTVKNTTTTKTFTIINDGDNALDNMSVVSSNNEIFTVSETGFDIPAEGSKVITVTFVKDVAGDYSETITVSQANVDNKVVNVTATYEAPTPAAMVITIAEAAVGETVAFGSVGKQAEKTFTITNDGDQMLNITSIVSDNTTDFTVSPENLEVAGHSSETFTVTFVYDAEALNVGKTATITITPSNEGVAPKSFTVTGTCIEQWSEDFSGGSLPEGWEIENSSSSTYWAFNEGYAKGTNNSYYYTYLITPALTVEEGDALSFDIKDLAYGYYRTYIVEKQVKGESGWSAWSEVASYGNADLSADWLTKTISGLAAGTYKFRFKSNSFALDNFQGFKRNQNDPKMGAYTDAECTVAAASSVTKDFGFVTEDATYTYYIKNDGTGTLVLDQEEVPAGFSAVLGKSELAKDESTSLTITFGQISGGYRGGNIVVNGNDGSSFTVAVSGVMVDNSKLNLNFATDNIPTTWTANAWTKDGSGYIKTGESGYSNTSMETSTLTATAGEQLVVVAKNGSTSSSYTFGVKYKQVGAEEWSDLIPATNIGTSWKTLTGTIAEAGDYLLQFNGYYASIQRIYGLTEPQEPVMVVYDGESLAGATYDFGNVANDADAEWTLTVKNEGKAVLEGLTAALSGDQAAHYSVEVTGLTDGNLAANATATITVKQLKDNLGTHTATLTISATSEGIADKVITLSGTTRDASKMFVDFSDGSMPEGWTVGTSWTVTSGYAQQSSYNTASALVTTPLTVTEGETLTFQAARYSSYSAAELKARYTMDGGVTWSEYVDYASQITSGSFVTLELTGVPAGTAVVEFYGRYVKLDNISGFAPTTAPLFALATSETLTDGKYDFGQSLQAAPADKVFTITNSGNGNLVSTIAATGDVTAVLATTDGELSNENQTVTLEPGESATITVSLTFDAAAPGAKTGSVTITSNEPVADVALNFTAKVIDATAVNEDLASLPAGWYNNGWTVDGTAHIYSGVAKELITEQYEAEAGKNVLSFEAKQQSAYGDSKELNVYTSADRKAWTLAKTVTLTAENQTVTLDALADGVYYVKFESLNASIDNLTGLKKIIPAPEHDLYITTSNIPVETKVPETSITATATVASLRAAETGVYAKLFFDETEVATADAQDIALNGTASFTLTGNVPVEEKTYAAKIVVYYSDNSVAFETLTTDVEVAHTRTLSISEFTREGEGAIDANASNQFSAAFSVKVQNTGTTEATPTVKIFIGETEVGSATAADAVAVDGETMIAVNVTNASAGEGGVLHFTAKAYWTAEGEALATSASDVTITVNAAAPKFALYEGETALENNAAVNFGLQKDAKTFSYTIKNEGNKAMELVSIVAPEGFEATALTEGNKTIAVDRALDIDVTLKAEQGKVAGNLVITYKVDENTNNTFTLALSGRSINESTWVETFDSEIPASWTNNGWEWNSSRKAAYSTYTAGKTLMSPRLAANAGDVLTFDVIFPYSGYSIKAQYSTDRQNWSEIGTYTATIDNQTIEAEFTAPADGNYYIKLGDANSKYVYVDNFVGFELNIPEHDIEIAASNIPTTGTQYAVYTASVTLQENAGKAEEVTAKLIVNGEEKDTENETLTANGQTVITLTWTPEEVIAEAVKAKITVTGTEIDLTTEEVDLTIAEPYTLDETSSDAVVNGTYEVLVLNRSWVAGFNTVCLPFATTAEEIFGKDAIAYEFAGLIDNELRFTEVVTMEAGVPYLVEAKAASTDETKKHILHDVEIGFGYTAPDNTVADGITFQGTYAPMAAGTMDGLWGVTPKPSIAKGTADASMKGFRAYFDFPTSAEVKGFRFEADTATGVRYVKMSADEIRDIFDLGGRKLNETRKGINIVNGKKVLVK